jgi:hypothetical protein
VINTQAAGGSDLLWYRNQKVTPKAAMNAEANPTSVMIWRLKNMNSGDAAPSSVKTDKVARPDLRNASAIAANPIQ